MKKEMAPEINLTARLAVQKMEQSADKLATDIKFKCNACKDTKWKKFGNGYKQCDDCPKDDTSTTGRNKKFF